MKSFYSSGEYSQIKTHTWLSQKMLDPHSIPLLEHMLRDKLNLTKQVIPGRKTHCDQAFILISPTSNKHLVSLTEGKMMMMCECIFIHLLIIC